MPDDFDSYVVCLVGSGDPEPFAHFLVESDAAGYARKRISTRGITRGYVFGVATTATGAAFNGVMRGEAELVESVAGGHPTGSSGSRQQAGVGTSATIGHRRDTQIPGTLMITLSHRPYRSGRSPVCQDLGSSMMKTEFGLPQSPVPELRNSK
jgi:hypothetical protein